MATLLKLTYKEPELFIFFTEKIMTLKKYESGPIDAGLFAVKNGYVYYFDGVYAFSDEKNQVGEVIISDRNKLGLILIDTKEASKTKKQLIKKLEEFLEILNMKMVELSKKNTIDIMFLSDRTTDDIKEEILLQHAV